MRKINSQDFRIATRRTPREINRRILLNLVREHQPVSRADLARRMQLARGGVSLLVNELIAEGLVYEEQLATQHAEESRRSSTSEPTTAW